MFVHRRQDSGIRVTRMKAPSSGRYSNIGFRRRLLVPCRWMLQPTTPWRVSSIVSTVCDSHSLRSERCRPTSFESGQRFGMQRRQWAPTPLRHTMPTPYLKLLSQMSVAQPVATP